MLSSALRRISRRQFLLNCSSSVAAAQLLGADAQLSVNQEWKPVIRIIPSPQHLEELHGRISLTNGHILCGNTPKEVLAAELLIDEARKIAGGKTLLRITTDGQRRRTCIFLLDWSADSALKTEITSLLSEEDKQALADPLRSGQS
jgi:hypothetical protein